MSQSVLSIEGFQPVTVAGTSGNRSARPRARVMPKVFVSGALRELLVDENFVNLLRAEKLETLPKYLAERVWPGGVAP